MIVDDDEWVRRGREHGLGGVPGVEVVAGLTHSQALEWGERWDDIDAVVIDAYDETEPWDRFPGVGVVEAVRSRRRPDQTVVVVISGHFLNDLLRLRMAEAGADFYYPHCELRDAFALAAAIVRPDGARRATPGDPRRLAALGLRPSSRPNAALRYACDAGLTDAFTPGRGQKSIPASRRVLITARARVAALAGLEAVDRQGRRSASGTPSWKDVVQFVNRARGLERRSLPPSR